MENRLLLIERDRENIWKNLPKAERESLLKYRGFDSLLRWEVEIIDPLRLDGGFASTVDLEKVKTFYTEKKLTTSNQVDLLIVEKVNDSSLKGNFLKYFSFIGYDIGVLEEYDEPVFFSLILNELRTNGNKYLRNIVPNLNQYYLFDNIDDCQQFLKLRENALSDNIITGIETSYSNQDIDIAKIFLYKYKE